MSRPLRVLHVVPAPFDAGSGVLGGAERFAFELARHMAARTPTRLLTFADRERRERIGELEVRVVAHPWHVAGQRDNPLALASFREALAADVVHCHQRRLLGSSLLALLGRLTGRRVFASDLGGGGWDLSAFVSTDRWYRGHLHISRYSLEVAGHGPRARAHVILGGVDAERFSPAETAAPGERALFVGRLLPHKGVDRLIEGLPPEIPLDVVGRPLDARYRRDLEGLAAGRQVAFHDGCDDRRLVELYRSALCVVLPSVYRDRYGTETRVPELLGQTLLEGMACGIPTLATRVASLPEVVEDGVTGLLVPPGDPAALGSALRWLREHPEERREMGRAGRRRVLERFTWPAVVDRCLTLYRS